MYRKAEGPKAGREKEMHEESNMMVTRGSQGGHKGGHKRGHIGDRRVVQKGM
jgi:hypothetical protein